MSVIDEFFAAVDAEIAAGRVRMLFWVCPSPHPTGRVVWDRTDQGAVPRCEHCGMTGAPR